MDKEFEYPPTLKTFDFDIDALTAGDAEYATTERVEAWGLDDAVQKIRDQYEARGNLIFRIRHIISWRPFIREEVWKARGQD